MSLGRDQPTYRVRRIPPYVQRTRLANFLTQNIQGLGGDDNIRIRSLAPSLGDCTRPPNQTATLTFKEQPSRFRDGRSEWAIAIAGHEHSLVVDTHFLDFTPMNDVHPDLYRFDCIAISGLASHPFGSWKKRDHLPPHEDLQPDFMWLRDQLPQDASCLRVLTYGYDTKLIDSESFQTIDDIALFFITKLSFIRPAEHTGKPIIFLAHSLGGIVLKRALLYLAGASDVETAMVQDIRMIIFFGVPNKGMHMSHMMPMVKSQPNHVLVESLSPSSNYLVDLDENFSGIALFRNIRLISAFETERSPTAVKTPTGKWEMQGDREVLVASNSAIQSGSRIPSDVFPINKTHSNIVKFSHDDPNYSVVIGLIRQVTERPVPQTQIQVEPEKDKVSNGVPKARIKPQEIELQEERRQRRLAENAKELLRGQRHSQSTEEAPILKPTPTPALEYRDGRIYEERPPSNSYFDEGYRYREEERRQPFTKDDDYERPQDALREKDSYREVEAQAARVKTRDKYKSWERMDKQSSRRAYVEDASSSDSGDLTRASPGRRRGMNNASKKFTDIPVLAVPRSATPRLFPETDSPYIVRYPQVNSSPRIKEQDMRNGKHGQRPTSDSERDGDYYQVRYPNVKVSPRVSDKDVKYSRHAQRPSTDESDREHHRKALRPPRVGLRRGSAG